MKKLLVLDTECFYDFYLAKFKAIESGVTRSYDAYPGKALDTATIRRILATHTIITFNGNGYDIPMLMLALRGASIDELKAATDWVIVGNHTSWEFYEHYDLERPDWIDHIDLIEVAPGQASLKLYGGRLHSRRLQDLPLDPGARIAPEQREGIDRYCENDLDTTIDLFKHLRKQIDLRAVMSAEYGVDLRSKSDAQVAEAVIRKEVSAILGHRVTRPTIPPGTVFRYKAPAFLGFESPVLREKLAEIERAEFVIDKNGAPIEPACLAGAVIKIGTSDYRMGIGGLHSSEQRQAHVAEGSTVLSDFDVASYYPRIVLNCGLFPKHLTDAFLKVYSSIVSRRLAAKRSGDSVAANFLKIVINGSFGKLGSMWSALYAPDLMIQVTVTGQLALLMLIERLERAGISVVSANTDGIVLKFDASREGDVRNIVAEWERNTGFEMEDTRYKLLASRDVNNYIAIKDRDYYMNKLGADSKAFAEMEREGWIKGKGAFGKVSISKNPQDSICSEAVKLYLERGVPVAETILRCRDIRQFLTVRTVQGGCVRVTRTSYDDTLTLGRKRDALLAAGWIQTAPGPLATAKFDYIPDGCGYDAETAYRMHCGEDETYFYGKVVRWYFSAGEQRALHYKTKNSKGNRNKVPNSEGAAVLMDLTDEFPSDIDYTRYIATANGILADIGAMA
jgi:hypothetical protein